MSAHRYFLSSTYFPGNTVRIRRRLDQNTVAGRQNDIEATASGTKPAPIELALAQVTIYLAGTPKSNAVFNTYKAATRVAKANGSLPPPRTILNAPTGLMKRIGYGEGYRYDHDEPDAFSGQDYWPDALGRQHFYAPTDRGMETRYSERLAWWERLRRERRGEE